MFWFWCLCHYNVRPDSWDQTVTSRTLHGIRETQSPGWFTHFAQILPFITVLIAICLYSGKFCRSRRSAHSRHPNCGLFKGCVLHLLHISVTWAGPTWELDSRLHRNNNYPEISLHMGHSYCRLHDFSPGRWTPNLAQGLYDYVKVDKNSLGDGTRLNLNVMKNDAF